MWGIDMLFVVGGNGGNAGAAAIQAQCEKDSVVCNVVGVPKSIDNDILVVCTLAILHCHRHSCRLRVEQSTLLTSLHEAAATTAIEDLGSTFLQRMKWTAVLLWSTLQPCFKCWTHSNLGMQHEWPQSPLLCMSPTAARFASQRACGLESTSALEFDTNVAMTSIAAMAVQSN